MFGMMPTLLSVELGGSTSGGGDGVGVTVLTWGVVDVCLTGLVTSYDWDLQLRNKQQGILPKINMS